MSPEFQKFCRDEDTAMKLAFQEGLFPYEKEDELYARLAEWGFDAVEVWGDGLADRVDRVRTAAKSAGLPVCAICPGLDGIRGSLLSADAETRRRAAGDIETLLQCGADLGGAGLNIVPEFGVEKFMRLSPDYDSFTNRRQRFLDELAPLAERARDLGAPILLEPLNRYEAWFLVTVDQGADLCRSSNSAVKILADLFHANIEEPDILDSLRRNIEYIGHVHVADSNRLLPGLGHTDFAPIFDALRQAGYSGYISMECAVTGDPHRTVPEALNLLKKLL